MTIEPVKIGIVGAGAFGRLHIQTLVGLAESQLVAVVDTDSDALAEAEGIAPGVTQYADLSRAIAESGAEAWVIATRTSSHIPIAKQILESGGKVLIEKPLAPNPDTARELEPFVANDSSNVMLSHVVLFAPEFNALLKQIKERGPVRYFHAVRHRPATLRTLFPEETPLGLTMVHDLYLALVMAGGQAPDSLSAELHPHPDGGYDLALAKLQWPGGMWGAFTASFLTPPGMPDDGFDRLEVFGEGWAARLSLNPRPIEVWSDRQHWPISLDIHTADGAPSGWLAEQMRCFCRVVRGQCQVPAGARYQDGLMLTDWLQTLEHSAGIKSC